MEIGNWNMVIIPFLINAGHDLHYLSLYLVCHQFLAFWRALNRFLAAFSASVRSGLPRRFGADYVVSVGGIGRVVDGIDDGSYGNLMLYTLPQLTLLVLELVDTPNLEGGCLEKGGAKKLWMYRVRIVLALV
jgi:hypothetical protein